MSPLVSSTNKTGRHDRTKIFLKVALNTRNQPPTNILLSVVVCGLLQSTIFLSLLLYYYFPLITRQSVHLQDVLFVNVYSHELSRCRNSL